MTSGAPENGCAPRSAAAIQYETLRMSALGGALPPEARSGLTFFLRRGMWGWTRWLTAPNACKEPTHPPSPSSTAYCERKAIVYVLAAVAMNIHDRRAV
jgi:hypothetical protein